MVKYNCFPLKKHSKYHQTWRWFEPQCSLLCCEWSLWQETMYWKNIYIYIYYFKFKTISTGPIDALMNREFILLIIILTKVKQISNLFGILKLAPPVRQMIHSRKHCNVPAIITSLWSENIYTIDFRIFCICRALIYWNIHMFYLVSFHVLCINLGETTVLLVLVNCETVFHARHELKIIVIIFAIWYTARPGFYKIILLHDIFKFCIMGQDIR